MDAFCGPDSIPSQGIHFIGIAQVTPHQPCTFDFHFHHFTLENIQAKKDKKNELLSKNELLFRLKKQNSITNQ